MRLSYVPVVALVAAIAMPVIYAQQDPNRKVPNGGIQIQGWMAKPDSGEITVLDGTVPKDLPETLARTGYVPERPHLYGGLTVGEAIRVHSAGLLGQQGRRQAAACHRIRHVWPVPW